MKDQSGPNELSTIERLWLSDNLPIVDGLFRGDGASWLVALDSREPDGLAVRQPFDLDARLAEDPEYVTSIDVTSRLVVHHGGRLISLCGGEGSHGSEGFVALLDESDRLVWVIYLERFNPFKEAVVEGSRVVVTSTSEETFTVDLNRAELAIPG
jgi:hypothetical protein